MDVKTKAKIKHNGKWYENGEEIKQIKREDAHRLIGLSLAFETEVSVQARNEAVETARKAAEEKAEKEADAAAKKKADEVAKVKAEADKKGK